jgi:hypothetical protein
MKKLLMMVILPIFAIGLLGAEGNVTDEGAAVVETNTTNVNVTEANITAETPAP